MTERKRPLVIGFTGGVGSGKSTVLKAIEKQYDVHLIGADRVGGRLMKKGKTLYRVLRTHYGDRILLENGEINKKALAEIAFRSQESQKEINALEHPVIRQSIVNGIRRTKKKAVILEAALLSEGGLIPLCDLVISVITEPSVRIDRLMASRGYSREKCLSIIEKQMDNGSFEKISDRVFHNDGELSETLTEVFDYLDGLKIPKRR